MLLSRTETDPEDPPGSRPILAKRELATSVVVLGSAPAFLDIENMSWCFLDAIQVFLGPRSADSPVPGGCRTDAPDHEWHLGLWCPRSGEGGLQVLRTRDDPGDVGVLGRANRSVAREAERFPNFFHSRPVLLLFNVSTSLQLIEVAQALPHVPKLTKAQLSRPVASVEYSLRFVVCPVAFFGPAGHLPLVNVPGVIREAFRNFMFFHFLLRNSPHKSPAVAIALQRLRVSLQMAFMLDPGLESRTTRDDRLFSKGLETMRFPTVRHFHSQNIESTRVNELRFGVRFSNRKITKF